MFHRQKPAESTPKTRAENTERQNWLPKKFNRAKYKISLDLTPVLKLNRQQVAPIGSVASMILELIQHCLVLLWIQKVEQLRAATLEAYDICLRFAADRLC